MSRFVARLIQIYTIFTGFSIPNSVLLGSIQPFYFLQRFSMASPHEITHRVPIVYMDSVSHGVNVDKKNGKKANFLSFTAKRLIPEAKKAFLLPRSTRRNAKF